MIQIITDIASDITLAQAKNLDITLLPLPVTFGEAPYDQLGDEAFTAFYDMLERSDVLPVTSLTPPADYLEVFEEVKRKGDSAVVIPLSSQLSGSWKSACMAKEMIDYEDIYVLDVHQALIGQRILVEEAVRLRSAGKSAGEIAACVLNLSGRIRLFGALDTLKYLVKGGRISKGAGMIGSALHVKPIVCLKDGAVGMAGKARGRDGAIAALLQHIGADANFDPAFPFYFGYTKNREQLEPLLGAAAEAFGLQDTRVYPVGGVIGTHVGPNAMVVAWVVAE